jgi:Fe-S-cluster containining protein
MLHKKFPDNLVPLGNNRFNFSCQPGLSCFMQCCKNVDMYLFPYDIIRMKNAAGQDSETFLREHARLVQSANPFFPSLMLKLNEDENKSCPFLAMDGCSIYHDRPSSCRTYPLERAVDRDIIKNRHNDYYFMTDHSYCLGHGEEFSFSVKEWIRNQKIDAFNMMNDLWAEMESIFLTNPWKGEGSGGPKQQLAFMVCYNIDGFRSYAQSNKIIELFRLSKDRKRDIECNDAELLKFGFEWLKLVLTGKSNLIPK